MMITTEYTNDGGGSSLTEEVTFYIFTTEKILTIYLRLKILTVMKYLRTM
jgi:hypothetical protein